MERPLRRLIGTAAIVGPGAHLLSDILEWVAGGFTPAQLWVNYVAFVLMPFLMVGLYAVQRPQAGWGVLWGALLYGAAFVYFGFTTLYALREHVADYAALWQKLGALYTVHGGLMVVGGVLFAVASRQAGVLPRGAVLAFLAGVLLNLLFSLLPVSEQWQTIANTVRNVGLVSMGVALLRRGDRSEPHSTFYPRWIAANGWAEAAGLGTTLLLGRAVAPALERDAGLAAVLLTAVAAVILGILLEGVLVGSAQAWVLQAALRGLSATSWIKATMFGAGTAWLLGTVPSTVAALMASGPSSGAGPTSEPSVPVQYGLAALLGALTGPVLGLAQWLVLRRHVARAGRWILANAVAWALGMVVIFLGMDQVPWRRGGLGVVLGVYLVCGGAGLVVGAIHGWVLRDLVGEASSAPGAG